MPIGNDFFPTFSEKEFERRRKMIRASMQDQGLDCLIIYGAYGYAGNDTGQVNAVYLSNYASVAHSYIVFPLKEDPTLIISTAFHIPNAKDISAIQDIRASRAYEIADSYHLCTKIQS